MERFTLSVRRFRRLAIVTTVAICVLVVAGGVVRLTGSGLGCDDWPNCNDTSFIDVSSGHAAIEQVNRIFSGLVAIPTVLMAVGSFRVRPARRDLRWPSIGVLVTVLANGVVGGLAVRGDLHPALVQSHFLLAMASIAFCVVAVRRSAPHDRPDVEPVALPRSIERVGWAVGAGTALSLVTGTVVTGTGPHAGEEDVRRFGFDISNVARIHSVAVLVTIGLVLALIWMLRREPGRWSRYEASLTTWMFVAVVQGSIGYLQYFNGVPELLVGAHIAGATLLWVVTVGLVLTVVGDGRDEAADGPIEPAAAPASGGIASEVAPSA